MQSFENTISKSFENKKMKMKTGWPQHNTISYVTSAYCTSSVQKHISEKKKKKKNYEVLLLTKPKRNNYQNPTSRLNQYSSPLLNPQTNKTRHTNDLSLLSFRGLPKYNWPRRSYKHKRKTSLTKFWSLCFINYSNITRKKYNKSVTFFLSFVQDSQTKFITYRDPLKGSWRLLRCFLIRYCAENVE